MSDEITGIGLSSTGFRQRVEDKFTDKIPEYDPRSGDHFWTMILMYRCDPEVALKGNAILDLENLAAVTGPGCYYCETPYSKYIAKRRCPGEPK